MKKKVLLIGPDFYGYNQSIEKALKYYGYEVKTAPYLENLVKKIDRIKFYLLPKLGISLFKDKYVKDFNNFVLKLFNSFNPDIILVIKGNILTEKTINLMNGSIKVLWMMDSIFSVNKDLSTLKEYDFTFMFEENDVEYLREREILAFFLPVGFDESVYNKIDKLEKDIDIVFIGALYGGRREFFEKLIIDFKHLNIKIYGKYLEIRNPFTYYKFYLKGFKKYFTNTNTIPIDTNYIYNKSKIAINLHHKQSVRSCNPRFFEILASNTFQLVDNKTFIEENFKNNFEIVTFSSYEELKEQINMYLDNPIMRENISERGYKKVLLEHSFNIRIKSMLHVLNNSKMSNREVLK